MRSMLQKGRILLRYAKSSRAIIKGIQSPGNVLRFLRKDAIFDIPSFVSAVSGETLSAVESYLREAKEEGPGPAFWQEYGAFEKTLDSNKEGLSAGGMAKDVGMMLYALVRLQKPDIVVETGVASGVSSAYILLALAKNKKGKLFSIDLPYALDEERLLERMAGKSKTVIPEGKKPGWLVPEELRSNWHLEIGKSSEKLPGVLQKTGSVDLFIHDSEHSYENMLWEYRTVWPFLKKGGFLLSDDIGRNSAFDEFSKEVGERGFAYRGQIGGIKKS